jgi:ATP-binding cassette subfamily C (CFTR/MRP) protein 1
MLGFTSLLQNIIQGLRITELKLSSVFRRLLCIRVFLGNAQLVLLPTHAR